MDAPDVHFRVKLERVLALATDSELVHYHPSADAPAIHFRVKLDVKFIGALAFTFCELSIIASSRSSATEGSCSIVVAIRIGLRFVEFFG